MELPVAALLRPLVAEHRPGVEHFLRQGLGKPVGDERAAHARGVLGPQRDGIAAPVLKVYISFVTTSEVSPSVREKTRVSSNTGVAHSSKP